MSPEYAAPQTAVSESRPDIRDWLCEGDGDATLHLHLEELYRVIQRLMDAAFTAQDQDLKVLLAGLEHEARLCKQEIERRSGVRN